MKLLHVSPDGTVTPVESEYQLRGVMDAFGVAQHTGDGKYIADFMDGTYLQFAIEDGQAPQGGNFLPDVQYGNPYRDTEEGQRARTETAGGFPSLVPDVAGTPHNDGGQAYEDYTPGGHG